MSDSTDSKAISPKRTPEAGSPVLTEAERHKILVEWNQTEREYPRNKCVHHLFEEQVERTPDAVAVMFEEQSLTYRELNVRANQLAHHLRSLGVGPDSLVALCLERSLEMIVAILGTLKAGAAYVPIDPAYPADRIAFMLADTNAPVLLTQETLRKKLPPTPAKVICLDSGWEVIQQENKAAPATGVTADNLVYVIYTSGSTGQPKGVLVPHRGVVRLVKGTNYVSLSPADTLLHLSPMSFDASTFEIWGALLNGGRMVLLRPGSPTPAEIGEAIRQYGVTILWLTASLFHLMVDECLDDLKPLRQLLAGGDVLSPERVRKAFQALPGCRIINGYGPTENTTFTCCYVVTDEQESTSSVPIGRPIANTRVYILDSSLQPVPVGVEGELYAGGDGVARGYLNQLQLTAERFIPDFFSDKPHDMLYRTGDLARYLTDGNIEFLGRMDSQVKIRGFRIELGEIEAVLSGHSGVAAGAVRNQDRGGGDKELVAYVVGREPNTPSINSLRQWLGEKLPDHMIPSRFVAVPALPLNPNGKVDRKALEKLDGVELTIGTDYVAPRNERERELVQIWQAVLRRERIGIQDNFFHLGGHSLLAAVIVSQINRRLGLEVSLRCLFEHSTIEKLAIRLAAVEKQQQKPLPIEKADRGKPLSMSFGQQRMWLVRQELPDPATYNAPVLYRVCGQINVELLRKSLRVILNRHEVLRTALLLEGDKMVQKIIAPEAVAFPWEEEDLRAVPAVERSAVMEQCLTEEVRRPFDLAHAPLWRALWLTLGEDEQMLVLTFHHSIVDEWSMRLLFHEWEQLYASDADPIAAGLAELQLQYADYAVWQRRRLSGSLQERERAYWHEQFKELPPPLELSANQTQLATRCGRGAVHRFKLSGTVATALRRLARQEGTSLFSLVLVAFQVLIHRYTGQGDFVVGLPAANRERPEVQALLGFFLNTLPLRARLESNVSFRDLVAQVREKLREALEHSTLPFEQMVEMAAHGREGSQNPLFQVMFVLLEQGQPQWKCGQATAEPQPVDTKTSKCDLLLAITAEGAAWLCELEYATDLFTAESAEQMAIHFEELLRSITANPDLAVGQLNLLPADERHRLLVEWNRTEREYPRDQCVHQLFEAQVERTPEAVAVEFEGRSLTYRELNCRANQLAHHLRGLGVGPDTPVALCVERSLEMVVGPLGILKAGGAYVPLDPSYPSKRLAYLIGNMATPVLVTQAALVSRFPGSRIKTIYLENLPPDTTEDNPNLPISTKNLAYILYTSGSTGQPKGVAMEHGPLVNLMHWQVSQTQVPLRTLQFASLSFDVSFQEIFSTWLSGGTLVVVDSQTRLNPAALWEFVTERKLERLFLPVVMLQHLADAAAGSSRTAPELREVITAGEQLRITPAIRSFFAARPGCTLHNHYGPTESHVVTAWTLPSCPANWPELPPIGRPIANATIYLLDAQMNLVPVGRPGELYIGGAALARGYWRQSGITAERFVPDPFAPNTNARLYRTGDLAYYRPDGNIEYLGRIDFQVKIRGFRIELGEIETVLHVQPEVREAAAIVREDTPDDKRLIAYLVAKNGEKPDVLTLRKRLAEKLPDYMIPNHFVWLDRLPLTPNGKLDRKALRAPETSDGSKPDLKSRPINMLELELIRIWRRLFQREGISRRDNFFALGGHSLLAARLAAEIDKLLKCKLPIATLFQSPTIESLARRLADDNWAPPWSSLVPLQPQGSKPPLFLVHGWGGDVYGHLKLAKLLPPDQPSYGIQAVGLDGKSARHITVEEMAAHYVTEIVSFQPDGPIYLAGYSMGGLIAFEVAQQLHRLGRRVAMLALLDSAPISEIPWVFYGLSMATYIPDRCLFHFRRWLTLSRHEKSSYLRGRWTALRFWINNNFSKPPPVTIPPQPASQPPQVPGFGDYYHAVASAYRVRPYSGSADIFVSDQANPEWKWWYWKYYVRGGVSCHRIPGRHLQILSPDYLPALAKSLTTVIHRTQEKERNTPHSHSGHNISTTEPITTLEKLQDD